MRGAVRRAAGAAGAVCLLLSAGCADTDPYLKPGQWQPTGANMLNLTAMLANPSDLRRGRGERYALGNEAAPPITRLSLGRPAPLPSGSSNQAPTGNSNAAPTNAPN